jgi:hypothetical protein
MDSPVNPVNKYNPFMKFSSPPTADQAIQKAKEIATTVYEKTACNYFTDR